MLSLAQAIVLSYPEPHKRGRYLAVWLFFKNSGTILAGAIWAQEAWGAYWNWDPKEVWSLVIFIVYAAYLHSRVTVGWSGRKAAVVVIIGFACILINYGVVNVYFVGQHSYSGL